MPLFVQRCLRAVFWCFLFSGYCTALAAQKPQNDSTILRLLLEKTNHLKEPVPVEPATADACFELGKLLFNRADQSGSLRAFRKCLEIREKLLAPGDPQIAAALYEIGEILYNTGQPDSAFVYFERSLRIVEQSEGPESNPYSRQLNLLGRSWLYSGYPEKGLELCEKALSIQLRIAPLPVRNLSSTYYTLGMCYRNLHRCDDALYCFQKNLEYKVLAKPNDPGIFPGSYSEIGSVYLEKKDMEMAAFYFIQANDIMVQIRGDTEWTYAYTCRDMARLRCAQKNYQESEEWYLKAIGWLKRQYNRCNEEVAVWMTELGAVQTAAGKYDDAFENFSTANLVFEEILGPENNLQYKAESGMGNLFREKYLRSGNIADLQTSREWFAAAEKSADRLIRFETAPLVRKKWLAETKKVFEGALATELLFQDSATFKNAWHLSETMHGFELFAATSEVNALRTANIPAALLEQEKSLRQQIIDLQRRHRHLTEEMELLLTDTLVLNNNALLFAAQKNYCELIRFFENDYPEYHQLKYGFKNIAFDSLQKKLGENQTLVEYFTGDTVIYALIINRDDHRLVAIPRHFPLDQWITQFREGINGAQLSGAEYQAKLGQYATSAHQLYEKLITPIADWLQQEVIIIPDGALNFVPFEALLATPPKDVANFKTYPFWVKEKSVGYAVSGTMLDHSMRPKSFEEFHGDLLAFAPFFFGDTTLAAARVDQEMALRKGFQPLPFTGEEVLRVSKRIGGKSMIFNGKDAVVQQFTERALHYRILHLATHGKANVRTGEFSYLAFYSPDDSLFQGRMYVSDIYNLRLHADLVMLSACETGLGELFDGEGVVSLARAFSFAGARSVVTALWSVNDRSTLDLTDQFYKALSAGNSKNNALSEAKRQYLKNHPGSASHPFYWAGFVQKL